MEFNILNYFVAFFASFVAAYFFTKLAIFFSKKWNILDKPDSGRKIHDKNIPLLGGWGIYLGFLIVCLIYLIFFPNILLGKGISLLEIFGFLFAGFVLMIFGTLDDKYNLSAKAQFIIIIFVCLFVVLSGISINLITRPGGGVIHLDFGIKYSVFGINFYLIGSILTFLWLLFMTNVTKLLDGLDGLASGVTAIGMIILFIVSLFWDKVNSANSIFIIAFLGAILGFLILNFYPAKVFLGNGGSNLLGLYLGIFSIISGAKIATAFLVMGAPLIDMIWVIIQRIAKGESPFRHADKKHLHFKLLDLGFSKSQAVLVLYFIAFLFGSVSLFQNTIGKIVIASVLILFMIILFFYINKKQKHENTIQ